MGEVAHLSVNINKIALLRNSRGGNLPDVLQAARDIERFGAQGITVHPRPDERHIRYQDVIDLKAIVTTEFNIEGYPSKQWMDLVRQVKPTQATLVPDAQQQLTSDHGWDTREHWDFLHEICNELQDHDIRVSIFVDPVVDMVAGAAACDADRIELYTGPYAHAFAAGETESAIKAYAEAAQEARNLGLGVNAGHDLNLHNLKFFKDHIPNLAEVSIGHALVSDALYLGLEESVKRYLGELG
jgi:pyridoxine 5-phosphate synthase